MTDDDARDTDAANSTLSAAQTAAVAGDIVDELRQLLNVLAALLLSSQDSQARSRIAHDASQSRSLPALSKVLRRLWFAVELGTGWEDEEQVHWLSLVLLVSEGSRAGNLSFFGASSLLHDATQTFAQRSHGQAGLQLDQALLDGLAAVKDALAGVASEELQYLPADHLCGAGKDGLLSTNRLPALFRRTFDLEGHRLTKAQAAGLGVAIVLPGSGILAGSVLGATLLARKLRHNTRESSSGTGGAHPLEQLQGECQKQAKNMLRRKMFPIDVTYLPGAAGLGEPRVKVCAYSLQQAAVLCAVPAGGFGEEGGAVATLSHGDTCSLRPKGDADTFWIRVFRPALLDVVLCEGLEVHRGGRVVIVPTANGEVKCYTRQQGSKAITVC